MKKLIIATTLTLGCLFTAAAQDKGSYLTVGGNLGFTKFMYDLDGGDSKGQLGYGGYVGFQYYFTRNWGLALEPAFNVYNTQSRYDNKTFTFQNQLDDETHFYDLNVRLKGWEEDQVTYLVDIPLLAMYQHKFGEYQRHGLYAGAGVKFHIPVKSTYERNDGTAELWGYYPAWNLNLGADYPLPVHGYGDNNSLDWNDDNELEWGLSLTGRFGGLIGLSKRVDLTVGVSVDFGLKDMQKDTKALMSPIGDNQQQASYIGENITYSGVLNSNEVNHVLPLALRGELGLRIKLGQVTDREKASKKQDKDDEILDILKQMSKPDTIIVNPIIQITPDMLNGTNGGYAKGQSYEDLPIAEQETISAPVYFDLNKTTLSKQAQEELDRKAQLLKQNSGIEVTIIGHTCDLGSDKLNYDLGMKRADAVRYYLIKKGVKASRLSVLSGGKWNPEDPNDTEEHRRLNRKAEFVVGE